MNDTDLERDLRARFAVRTERFAHGDFVAELVLPRAADELIDLSEFNTDERLPYWAELWPSARALTRHLLDGPRPAGPVLELGCGVALPALALRRLGVEVLATDYYAEALDFARANAVRNGLAPLRTLLLDWRAPPADLGGFPLTVAADVLYESRNAEALATLLPRVVAPGGRALLADPGRVYAGVLRTALLARGWSVEPVGEREEPSGGLQGDAVSRVTIWECRRGL